MARKKKFSLSKEAVEDLDFLRKNELTLEIGMFKTRIMGLTGYPDLRNSMEEATEENWLEVYNKYIN